MDSSQTQTQAANQDCTGLASIFQPNGKEAFLTHTGSQQNFTELHAFVDFLESQCDEWDFNERKLQSDWSDVCGQYCVFYLSHRARGYSMNKIVQLFNDNTMLNDAKVSRFVNTHFRLMLTHPNVNLNQFVKSWFNQNVCVCFDFLHLHARHDSYEHF